MYESKDGSKHGSRFVARRKDAEHSDKTMAKDAQVGSIHEAEHKEDAAIPDVSSVHVYHDHANGVHKVIAHHMDGSMSESDHDNAKDAHDHAAACSFGQQGPRNLKSDMKEFQDTAFDNLA